MDELRQTLDEKNRYVQIDLMQVEDLLNHSKGFAADNASCSQILASEIRTLVSNQLQTDEARLKN